MKLFHQDQSRDAPIEPFLYDVNTQQTKNESNEITSFCKVQKYPRSRCLLRKHMKSFAQPYFKSMRPRLNKDP